jgi:hypothetical protein
MTPGETSDSETPPGVRRSSVNYLAAGVAVAAGAGVATFLLACFFECFFTGAVALVASFGAAGLAGAAAWAKVIVTAASIKVIVFMAFFLNPFEAFSDNRLCYLRRGLLLTPPERTIKLDSPEKRIKKYGS